MKHFLAIFLFAVPLFAQQQKTADTIIVTDVSCAMHMNGGLHRRGSRTVVKHLAELLASTK